MRRYLLLTWWLVVAAVALAYLRDPGWLIRIDSGFRGWERAPDGRRYRWTGGHASFFVPSDAVAIDIPVRTAPPAAGAPVTALFSIDDRPAEQLVLTDGTWHVITLHLPARGDRQVRRIDIHVDRTRDGNRGVAIGDVAPR